MSTSGTIQFSSSTTMTLSASNGISLGDSNVFGFETGSGTVGVAVPSEVTLNKMAGKITSETVNLAASAKDEITLFNSRVTASSIVMVNPGGNGGCRPMVYTALPSLGSVDIRVMNMASTACTQAYTLNFIVIN